MKRTMIFGILSTLLGSASLFCGSEPYPVVGIKNSHNSCFINAAVQMLRSMRDITHTLKEAPEGTYTPGSLGHSFVAHLKELEANNTDSDPDIFNITAWEEIREKLGTQCDTNELLMALLDCLIRKDLAQSSTSERLARSLSHSFSINTLKNRFNLAEQFVTDPCQRKMDAIVLPMVQENRTLDDCLKQYFSPSVSHTDLNGRIIPCFDQQLLKETQNYLICTLSRNSNYLDDAGESKLMRLDNKISFPLYNLSLREFFAHSNDDKGVYELIGFTLHKGTGHSGHYTSFVKSGNQWHYCNDKEVVAVNEEDVFTLASRGYGSTENTVVTTLIYELASARAEFPPAKIQPPFKQLNEEVVSSKPSGGAVSADIKKAMSESLAEYMKMYFQ